VLLSGRKVPADECLAHGLFQRVVARDELDSEVQSLAARIAGLDPDGVRAMKQLVRLVHDDDFSIALSAGVDHQERLMSAPEFAARVRTILDSISTRAKQ
jgi:enoyl-CoA hydratase/carnithine racemase